MWWIYLIELIIHSELLISLRTYFVSSQNKQELDPSLSMFPDQEYEAKKYFEELQRIYSASSDLECKLNLMERNHLDGRDDVAGTMGAHISVSKLKF